LEVEQVGEVALMAVEVKAKVVVVAVEVKLIAEMIVVLS